jgi:hypothetical protein
VDLAIEMKSVRIAAAAQVGIFPGQVLHLPVALIE